MFTKILVGYDGSETARDALALAHRLVDAGGGEIILGNVYEHYATYDALTYGDFAREARASAERTLADVVTERPIAGTFVTGASSASAGLYHLAELEEPDLVVVGSTHRGAIGRVATGSTGERLLHGAPCPVAVAPVGTRDRAGALATVGVGFDGSPQSRVAVAEAARLAGDFGASLRLITAIEPTGFGPPDHTLDRPGDRVVAAETRDRAERALSEVMEALPEGIAATSEVREGRAVDVLVAESAELDLLLCGSRNYGLIRQVLLGGVTADLINNAACPVLVFPRGAGDRETVAAG